jgi:hypothetical protein
LTVTDKGDEMPEDPRFGAPAGPAAGRPADDYGFYAPAPSAAPGTGSVAATAPVPFAPGQGHPGVFQPGVPTQPSAPAPFGTPAPFGGPVPEPLPEAAERGLPVWAVAVFAVAVLAVLGIVAAIVLPALLNNGHGSELAATRVRLPASVVGLARSSDPAAQSQADRLAATLPRDFVSPQAAAYVGDGTLLLVAAAKAPHQLTIAEEQVITQSFWAVATRSVPDGSSLDAPSPPSGAIGNGMLTCAPEVTPDGGGAMCIDVQPTAIVVYTTAGAKGADQAQETAVPAAIARTGH